MSLHINLRINLSVSTKQHATILIRIAVIKINFEESSYQHWVLLSMNMIFLHLFIIKIYLIRASYFSTYTMCTYFVIYIPKCFVVFVNTNHNAFLILSSTCSLLVYRKAIGLYITFLYYNLVIITYSFQEVFLTVLSDFLYQ